MSFSSEKISALFTHFSSDSSGISQEIVRKNQEEFGKNTLPEKKKNLFYMFLQQFKSPLVFLLIGAICISLALPLFEYGKMSGEDAIDALVIFTILILNAGLGFFQEARAENTLAALKKMQPKEAIVLRDGEKKAIDTEDLVAGDIVFLAEGDAVPADIRLFESVELHIAEAALTGESNPVEKNATWSGEAVVADQKNMAFSGTQITSGRGVGLVVAVGQATELGKIATLVASAESPPTPLENRLAILGKKIGLWVMGVCFLVFIVATFHEGVSIGDALLTAVALAVGAVPEGLPAVMTISLAVGVAAMARKNALVRELRAVETLGSVTVIASDKTGTITENKMTTVEIYDGEHFFENFDEIKKNEKIQKMLMAGANCNDAELPNLGDPTEIGLLQIASDFSAKRFPRIAEIPFSSEKKWMSTTHEIQGERTEFLKGAPEKIAEFCAESERKNILEAAEKMARKGLRTIAVAQSISEKTEFLGIFGLLDPPRKTAAIAIKTAKKAGIRTIMITGDHGITAEAIGKKIGLTGSVLIGTEIETMSESDLQKAVKTTSIFARVSPEHKVRICEALQKNGEIVAMTGDGVNDAPAISRAQVGISMGKVGTSVAREASDLILLDDHYATIVRGVREGRRIFSNIKKSVSFLLRTNFAEVLILFVGIALSFPLPLLPIHLLFVNLLTDSFPALALAFEPADKGVMKRKPRPASEGFLDGEIWGIVILGTAGAAFALLAFIFAILQGVPTEQAQTLTLATIVFIELIVIFSIRRQDFVFSREKRSPNPWILQSVILALVIFAIGLLSPLSSFLQLVPFPLVFWGFPVGGAIAIFSISEILKIQKKY